MIDLVCLVADKNMEAVVSAVLARHQSLGIRPISMQMLVHPRRDPGCYHDPCSQLRGYVNAAAHALVVFDRAWETGPALAAANLEADVDQQLAQLRANWAKGIVIDPEVEVWLFRRSPRLDDALGWGGRQPSLEDELASQSMWPRNATKPHDPKAAIEWALRKVQTPRSSSVYRSIASTLGMQGCTDPAFSRFKATLQAWFPVT